MTAFFGPSSPYLSHPLLTEDRTAAEVDLLITALGLSPGATVLDVGCGFGRHSIALAGRGFRPTGIDPSSTMIEAARTAADADGLDVTLITAPADVGPLPGGPYDGAIAMFTTLGQATPSGEDNTNLIAFVAASLRPGARFVIEVPQRDAAVAALVASDHFGDEQNGTTISRSYDRERSLVSERFKVAGGGVVSVFDLVYRLFSGRELAALLTEAGFVDVGLAAELNALTPGSVDGLDAGAPTMYATATAPTGAG